MVFVAIPFVCHDKLFEIEYINYYYVHNIDCLNKLYYNYAQQIFL